MLNLSTSPNIGLRFLGSSLDDLFFVLYCFEILLLILESLTFLLPVICFLILAILNSFKRVLCDLILDEIVYLLFVNYRTGIPFLHISLRSRSKLRRSDQLQIFWIFFRAFQLRYDTFRYDSDRLIL